jgi:hypothetical protein
VHHSGDMSIDVDTSRVRFITANSNAS